jgi:Arf-GAP/SH3 domain/ANK repeat/PH domain-containing protein
MCLTSLEVLFENDLKGGKYKSHVDSAVGQYESSRQRVEREEREELRKKAIPNWKDRSFMPEELAGKLEQDRRTFQMKTVEYMVRVLDVRYKRGIEFADHLLQFVGSQRGYFQDCSQLLNYLKEWEGRFSTQLTDIRGKHEEERKRLQALRDKVKSSMGMSKSLDGRSSMLPSVSSTDRTSKTGYLLLKPKNAFLKLARRRWQKVYCTANLNGFSVANSHTHAPHIQVPLIHYQCKDIPETEGHKYCFQLLTHTGSYIFDTESEAELGDWKSVIHHCQIVLFTDGPADSKLKKQRTFKHTGRQVQRGSSAEINYFQTVVKDLIKTIRRLPGNQICCDCSAPDPEWLSVNLGVLICIECSGQHRDLSVQFSRIRSIKLDDLHTSELLVARVMGNQLLNDVMEATLPSGDKPNPKSSIDVKKDFIHNKYLHKKFIEPSQTDVNYTIQHSLREAVDSRDIRNLLQVYADGADMCASLPDRSDNFNALHLAVEQEDMTTLHIVEFIASNSRAIEHQDIKGDTPLHLAAVFSSYHCLQLLLTKRPDFTLVNKSSQTPLDIAEEENNEECIQLIKEAKKGKFKKCENIDIDWGVEDPEENEGLYCSPEDLAAAKAQVSGIPAPPRHKHNRVGSSSSTVELHKNEDDHRYNLAMKRNLSVEPIGSPTELK